MKEKLFKLWLNTRSVVIGMEFIIKGLFMPKLDLNNSKKIKKILTYFEKAHEKTSALYADILKNGFIPDRRMPLLIEGSNEIIFTLNQYLETGEVNEDNLNVAIEIF